MSILPLQNPIDVLHDGRPITIATYTAIDPTTTDAMIEWITPSGDNVTDATQTQKLVLTNENRILTINDPVNADSGIYIVRITRQVGSRVVTFTEVSIQLTLHGKHK